MFGFGIGSAADGDADDDDDDDDSGDAGPSKASGGGGRPVRFGLGSSGRRFVLFILVLFSVVACPAGASSSSPLAGNGCRVGHLGSCAITMGALVPELDSLNGPDVGSDAGALSAVCGANDAVRPVDDLAVGLSVVLQEGSPDAAQADGDDEGETEDDDEDDGGGGGGAMMGVATEWTAPHVEAIILALQTAEAVDHTLACGWASSLTEEQREAILEMIRTGGDGLAKYHSFVMELMLCTFSRVTPVTSTEAPTLQLDSTTSDQGPVFQGQSATVTAVVLQDGSPDAAQADEPARSARVRRSRHGGRRRPRA
jgi:hypothetical protein